MNLKTLFKTAIAVSMLLALISMSKASADEEEDTRAEVVGTTATYTTPSDSKDHPSVEGETEGRYITLSVNPISLQLLTDTPPNVEDLTSLTITLSRALEESEDLTIALEGTGTAKCVFWELTGETLAFLGPVEDSTSITVTFEPGQTAYIIYLQGTQLSSPAAEDDDDDEDERRRIRFSSVNYDEIVAPLVVLYVDLDIDSDNDGDVDDDDDEIEDSDERSGHLVAAKAQLDLDGDGIPDQVDGFDAFSSNASGALLDAAGIAKFEILELKTSAASSSKVHFTYSASDPESATIIEDSPSSSTAAPGNLRLWRKDAAETRKPESIENDGDFIANGEDFELSKLTLVDGTYRIYIEGINPSQERVSVTIDDVSDEITVNMFRIDSYVISIDSEGRQAPVGNTVDLSVSRPEITLKITSADVSSSGNHIAISYTVKVHDFLSEVLETQKVSNFKIYLNDQLAETTVVTYGGGSEFRTRTMNDSYTGTVDYYPDFDGIVGANLRAEVTNPSGQSALSSSTVGVSVEKYDSGYQRGSDNVSRSAQLWALTPHYDAEDGALLSIDLSNLEAYAPVASLLPDEDDSTLYSAEITVGTDVLRYTLEVGDLGDGLTSNLDSHRGTLTILKNTVTTFSRRIAFYETSTTSGILVASSVAWRFKFLPIEETDQLALSIEVPYTSQALGLLSSEDGSYVANLSRLPFDFPVPGSVSVAIDGDINDLEASYAGTITMHDVDDASVFSSSGNWVRSTDGSYTLIAGLGITSGWTQHGDDRFRIAVTTIDNDIIPIARIDPFVYQFRTIITSGFDLAEEPQGIPTGSIQGDDVTLTPIE